MIYGSKVLKLNDNENPFWTEQFCRMTKACVNALPVSKACRKISNATS